MDTGTRPAVVLFDVNETLLDMAPLKEKINNLLKSKRGFRIWFGMLLHYSLVDNCANSYHDFTTIANATLGMAAKALDVEINEDEKKESLSFIKKLSAYPEVEEGLRMLADAGFRLATITNSPLPALTAQMDHAGLTKYFEMALSIDAIKKYKPAPETYNYAAKQLGVALSEMVMVAAHGWDITGASQAGMKTAFIERKGQSLYPLAPQPDFIGKDLVTVADSIIRRHNTG